MKKSKIQFKKHFGIIFFLFVVILLSNCTSTIDKKRNVMKGALINEKTGPYSEKYYLKSENFIENKWNKDIISKMDTTNIEYKIYNDGVFYNRKKDTIYILSTAEFWFKENAKIPDSIDIQKRSILTQCFLGIAMNDSLFYINDFNDHIHGLEVSTHSILYNDDYREKALSKFIEHILKNENTTYSMNNHKNESFDFQPYKPLIKVIDLEN